MQSVDRIAKTIYGALRKNTGGNDTVPISVWRGGDICAQRSMECAAPVGRGVLCAKVVSPTSSESFLIR